MRYGSFLKFIEPWARTGALRIAQRSATSPSIFGEFHQLPFRGEHVLRRGHRPAIDFAADQGTLLQLAGRILDGDGAQAPFECFGQNLAFRHHCVANETVFNRIVNCRSQVLPLVTFYTSLNILWFLKVTLPHCGNHTTSTFTQAAIKKLDPNGTLLAGDQSAVTAAQKAITEASQDLETCEAQPELPGAHPA